MLIPSVDWFTAALPEGRQLRKNVVRFGRELVRYEAGPDRSRPVRVGQVGKRRRVVPSGRDPITGMTYEKSKTRFWTTVYRLYDAGWKHPLRTAAIPGPLLVARTGDVLRVHFANRDYRFRHRHSMHFHGVRYAPGSDGAYIPGISGPGAVVRPGRTFTYVLRAGADSAGAWAYHDHSTSMEESIDGGMVGLLSILGPQERPPDREFPLVFMSMHGFMTINGRAFLGNTPVLRARVGQRVRWDVLGMGNDFHTFHVHGHRWRNADGTFADVRTFGPAESFVVQWTEDAPGDWLYHCHVEGYMMDGMIGLYAVRR